MECCSDNAIRLRLVVVLGGSAVAIGAAAIYWPAGLIVAGALAMRAAGQAALKQERQSRARPRPAPPAPAVSGTPPQTAAGST
jgi:hypothetical protein